MKIITTERQSLCDISLQCGSIDYLPEIAKANDMPLDKTFSAGETVEIPTIINKAEIKAEYCTGLEEEAEWILTYGYWNDGSTWEDEEYWND